MPGELFRCKSGAPDLYGKSSPRRNEGFSTLRFGVGSICILKTTSFSSASSPSNSSFSWCSLFIERDNRLHMGVGAGWTQTYPWTSTMHVCKCFPLVLSHCGFWWIKEKLKKERGIRGGSGRIYSSSIQVARFHLNGRMGPTWGSVISVAELPLHTEFDLTR